MRVHSKAAQRIQLAAGANNSTRIFLPERDPYGRLQLTHAPRQQLSSITASAFDIGLDLSPGFADELVALGPAAPPHVCLA